VTIQRRTRSGWRRAANDLGLQILWTVDDGNYRALWEPPHRAALGRYRFRITANRYRLVSHAFRLRPTGRLRVGVLSRRPRGVSLVLRYPAAVENADFGFRPVRAARGALIARVNGRRVRVRGKRGVFFVPAPPNSGVTIGQGAAHDRFGNRNRASIAIAIGPRAGG
jgi:hypothetical protein